MHYINGSYTNYINRRRGRNGHLFQGRYKAILVDGDSYLLELSRYLHLNPVRVKLVRKPEEYPYSSYRSYVSGGKEDFISRDLIWEMISRNHKGAPKVYREFVEKAIEAGVESPFKNIYGGVILGGQRFIKEALGRVRRDFIKREEVSHRRELQSVLNSDEVIDAIASHFNITNDVVLKDIPARPRAPRRRATTRPRRSRRRPDRQTASAGILGPRRRLVPLARGPGPPGSACCRVPRSGRLRGTRWWPRRPPRRALPDATRARGRAGSARS